MPSFGPLHMINCLKMGVVEYFVTLDVIDVL